MGRGRGGVTPAQRAVDHRPYPVRIAQHLIVPETENAISFVLDHSSARLILSGLVLTAVDLDDELGAMAREIRDEMTQRHLLAKVPIAKVFLEHSPKLPLGVCHFFPEAPCTSDRCGWRVMLHSWRSTPTITPPQPLPIKGRGYSPQLA